jgi:hypothetical protein
MMIRIGSGAGFAGDRLDPAIVLAEKGEIDYLILECLAERTIALAQKQKRHDPTKGYNELLEKRMNLLLPLIQQKRFRLITNMGAANPIAAAEKIVEIAYRHNIPIRVAAVTGDDVLQHISSDAVTLETKEPLSRFGEIISANAYLGADALLPALETGADIIITGRVADPSLFVAPMVYHYGWSLDDTNRIAQGTVVGHLLECAGQITGGYFADPGRKEVPNLAALGFPYADVASDGTAFISKVAGTGGIITLATVKEQLLYEITDPTQYVTPDVIADFTTVHLHEVGPDCIEVSGCRGRFRPSTLKVSVGYHAGFLGEGEISYAGTNALARAKLAGEVVSQRLQDEFSDLRIDYIGCTSLHGMSFGEGVPYEVRLRIAGKALSKEQAERIGEEVEALYTNGPAGGGGVRKYVNELIGIVSVTIPREKVVPQVVIREWGM